MAPLPKRPLAVKDQGTDHRITQRKSTLMSAGSAATSAQALLDEL